MNVLVLLTVLLVTAVALAAVLREVLTDDPRHVRGYAPPRSHHPDTFEPSGSTYR